MLLRGSPCLARGAGAHDRTRVHTPLVAEEREGAGESRAAREYSLRLNRQAADQRAIGRRGGKETGRETQAPSPSLLLTSSRLPGNQKYSPHPSPRGMKPRMPGAAHAYSGRHFFGWPPPWLQGFGHKDLGWLSRLAHASISLEPLLKS